jgi:peptidoglycan/LPS O-acetylase OafA/YrhL
MPSRRQHTIVALTSLRGLLALWVVIFHFWNDLTTLPLSPLAQRGDLAVQGFFILSGFVLARNHGDEFEQLERRPIARFFALRLIRIYPVHFATLMTVLVMLFVAKRLGFALGGSGYSATLFGLNLILAQSWLPRIELNWNFPSWSISSEWFVYLLFPIFAWAASRLLSEPKRANRAFVVFGAATVLVFLGWTDWPFRLLAIVIPTFLSGMCADRVVRGIEGEEKHRGGWSEACAIAIIAACFVRHQAAIATQLVGLQALVVCLATGRLVARRFWEARVLVYLGTISYSLYMTHTLAAKVINRLLPPSMFSSAPPLLRGLVLLAYAASVFVLAVLSYYLVERPAREWGRRKLQRGAATAEKVQAKPLELAEER